MERMASIVLYTAAGATVSRSIPGSTDGFAGGGSDV